MLAYLTYFQIFSSMFTCVVLSFFPHLLTYKQIAVIIAVVSAIILIPKIFQKKGNSVGTILTACLCMLVIVLYFLTSELYGTSSNTYNSFFLVLCGQVFPILLCATFVAQSEEVQNNIKRLTPLIGILFSSMAFMAAFFPTSTTSGGYMANDNGLNYHNTSYMAAYAAAFCIYYILCFEQIEWNNVFRKRIFFILAAILIFINLLTIFIAGGRGGLVLYIMQFCLAAYIYIKRNVTSQRQTFKIIGISIVMVGIILLLANFAESTTLKTNGYERILSTIRTGDSNGRSVLRDKAIACFTDKPLFGHGVGSVFYELGIYSHNCITDALLEIGVVGCVMYLTFFIYAWRRGIKLFNTDFTGYIWLVIFLDGFVMSLFSGYYIAQIPALWAATFLVCKNFKEEIEIHDVQ